MIPEHEAREKILARAGSSGVEERVLEDAVGRFFARDYRATIASPPFDNSAMDGYALRAGDAAAQGAQLTVVGEQPAGRDLGLRLSEGEAIRIFTGAPMPSGATAVIMQEDVEAEGGRIRVLEPVAEGEFIRRSGADLCVGQLIAGRGDRIGPRTIGLLASQGIAAVEVGRSPVASVITTGDEVMPLSAGRLEPGQIFNSNGPMLSALLRRSGVETVHTSHAADTENALAAAVEEALERSELVVLAGGVSVGERDFVKAVLERQGVTTGFWRVRVKPGKPFLFGHREGRLVFGLPGNPVSGFVTFLLFVDPAIRKRMGAHAAACLPETIPCTLDEALENPGDRPHYVRGTLDAATLRFRPVGTQQSHALYGLSRSDALVRLEAGAKILEGGAVPAIRI